MIVELYGEPALRNTLYATGGNPFNFDLIDLSPDPTGFELRDKVLNEYANLPKGKWPNFVVSTVQNNKSARVCSSANIA